MFSERQIARLLDLGNLACQKGMVKEAITIIEGVLALRPGFPPALVGLAFTRVVVDDFDGAQAILDRVLAGGQRRAGHAGAFAHACRTQGRGGTGFCPHSAGQRRGRHGPRDHGSGLNRAR